MNINFGTREKTDRRRFLSSLGLLALSGCGGDAVSGLTALRPDQKPNMICAPSVCHPNSTVPSNLATLTASEVSALTASQIASLSNSQIASFADKQLNYITNAQALHGTQASATLSRVAAAHASAPPLYRPPGMPAPPTPAPYTPPVPGSNFWGIVGTVIGGAIGTALGAAGGPIVSFLTGTAASGLLGYFFSQGEDAYYSFYNSDIGYWDTIDLGQCCTLYSENAYGQASLNSQGYTVQGTYSSGCSGDVRHRFDAAATCVGTVEITVIAN